MAKLRHIALAANDRTKLLRPPAEERAKGYFEVKFRGSDGVVFDISDRPWPGSEPIPKT